MRETWFDPWVGMIPWGRERLKGFPDSSVGKESACNAGDLGSIPGSGRSTGEGIDYTPVFLGFPCGSAGKESTCNAGDLGSIPEKGKGYPLQCSGLENSMDYIAHGVAKSETLLRDFENVYYSSTDTHISIKLTQASPCFSFLAVNLVILEGLFVYDLCENVPFPQVLWLNLQ